MRFGVHEWAWFAIGAAFGANLIFGLHLWLCGRRWRTFIDVPGGILTAPKRLTRRQAADIRRLWFAAHGQKTDDGSTP